MLATAGGNLFVFPHVLFPPKYCLAGEVGVSVPPSSWLNMRTFGVLRPQRGAGLTGPYEP